MKWLYLFVLFFLKSSLALNYEMVKDELSLNPHREGLTFSTNDLDRLTQIGLNSSCMISSRVSQEDSWISLIKGFFFQSDFGGGVGFFISPYGHILTAKHVVQDLEAGLIFMGDKCHYKKFKLIATHPIGDFALLKIEDLEEEVPPYLKLSSSHLEIGDWCFLFKGDKVYCHEGIYTPFFYPSLGKVLGKASDSLTPSLFISFGCQKGNSGSPVLNFKGEVVAICKSIPSLYGETLGITATIQVCDFKEWVEDILRSDGCDVPH